jgi:hypothetical protein
VIPSLRNNCSRTWSIFWLLLLLPPDEDTIDIVDNGITDEVGDDDIDKEFDDGDGDGNGNDDGDDDDDDDDNWGVVADWVIVDVVNDIAIAIVGETPVVAYTGTYDETGIGIAFVLE